MEDAETSTLETFLPEMQDMAVMKLDVKISVISRFNFTLLFYVHRLSFILINLSSNFSATCTLPRLTGPRIS